METPGSTPLSGCTARSALEVMTRLVSMTDTIWMERARLALQAAIPALERTLAADKARDRDATAISAVETTLWIRALGDCYDKFDGKETSVPKPPFSTADPGRTEYMCYQQTQGLRLVSNKGVHEMIFPTSENVRYDFFKTGIISANFTYCWSPLDAWENDILENRGERYQKHYQETLAGRSVVPTLASALSSFHNRADRMNLELVEAFADFDKQFMRYF